ncbi:hypothetical protein [Desulfuromonas thiophila]|uniref:hypothetical protein n=1 Tax=Desulfuromonas thiophila TaxID=57664 RepID=UPI0029F5342A|nr:hypothetical protein [Desulfuromonas thiophila]
MTNRRKHLRTCRRKKKYGTEQDAKARARGLWRQGIRTVPYLCPVCGGWHLTHAKGSPLSIFRQLEDQP